jgi:LmbE family N-acetylglucosaminyl deacetylase
MTGGELGTAEHPLQEIRAIRLREAAKSAGVIGAQFHSAGGYDLAVEYSAAYRRRAVRVIREVDPFLVFTHPPVDYHIDHEETSRLVWGATFAAPIPNFDCGVPTRLASGIPYLYYWDAFENKDHFGRPLPLSCAVEISSVLKVKVKMLACHASQRNWMRRHHHEDNYIELMKAGAKAEGERLGLKAAEGFIQHRGSSYPQDNVLKTILKDLCVEL